MTTKSTPEHEENTGPQRIICGWGCGRSYSREAFFSPAHIADCCPKGPDGTCAACTLDQESYRVTLCQLHAAAPALRDALRDLIYDGDGTSIDFAAFQAALPARWERARAALKLAGEE